MSILEFRRNVGVFILEFDRIVGMFIMIVLMSIERRTDVRIGLLMRTNTRAKQAMFSVVCHQCPCTAARVKQTNTTSKRRTLPAVGVDRSRA